MPAGADQERDQRALVPQRGYWIALIALAVLVTYGSLYPFDLRAGPEVVEKLRAFTRDRSLWTSLGDVLGNVALFVPLGFLSALVCRRSSPGVIVGSLAFGLTLSAGLQALQAFLPSRTPAMADVLWNGVGFVAGLASGLLGANSITSRRATFGPWDGLALIVVVFWVAAELLPLVPALDLSGLKAAARPLIYAPHADLAATTARAAAVLLVAWIVENRLGAARALALIPTFLAGVFVLQLINVGAHMTAAVPAGYVLGYFIWRASHILPEQARSACVLAFSLVAYTIAQLAPFELRSSPESFSWVPFAAVLRGSMQVNTEALLSTIAGAGTFLLVAHGAGARIVPMTIFLAIWVGLLEMTQLWIVGRTGDSTPIILTLCVGAAIGWLAPKTHVSHFRYSRGGREPERGPLPASHSRRLPTTAAARYFAVAATATAAFVIAGGIWLTLRLPGMPYNLLELFLWDARFPVLLVFALAALWVGSAASWGANILATSERPAFLLALLTVLAALVSLALLYASVTEESIDDIAGSNNLYWFVTNKDIWGQAGRELFLAIESPALIAFFERPVRYAALYGPLFIFPTVMLAFARVGPEKQGWRWHAATLGAAVFLLWLCKAIAFDWSSTDNLNELITRDGPWGLGGGGYLYALVGLVIATALSLSARMLSPVETVGRVALILLATLVGWWLLNEGLEARIEKYGLIFPGTQFLLGPDRAHLLDDATLFGRWVLVQTAALVVLATGVALANLWRRTLSTQRSLPDEATLVA